MSKLRSRRDDEVLSLPHEGYDFGVAELVVQRMQACR